MTNFQDDLMKQTLIAYAERILELQAEVYRLMQERDDLQQKLTEAFDSEVHAQSVKRKSS
jgi:hypothetical protein